MIPPPPEDCPQSLFDAAGVHFVQGAADAPPTPAPAPAAAPAPPAATGGENLPTFYHHGHGLNPLCALVPHIDGGEGPAAEPRRHGGYKHFTVDELTFILEQAMMRSVWEHANSPKITADFDAITVMFNSTFPPTGKARPRKSDAIHRAYDNVIKAAESDGMGKLRLVSGTQPEDYQPRDENDTLLATTPYDDFFALARRIAELAGAYDQDREERRLAAVAAKDQSAAAGQKLRQSIMSGRKRRRTAQPAAAGAMGEGEAGAASAGESGAGFRGMSWHQKGVDALHSFEVTVQENEKERKEALAVISETHEKRRAERAEAHQRELEETKEFQRQSLALQAQEVAGLQQMQTALARMMEAQAQDHQLLVQLLKKEEEHEHDKTD